MTMFKLSDGRIMSPDATFEYPEGILRPMGWLRYLTPEEKLELGIEDYTPPPEPPGPPPAPVVPSTVAMWQVRCVLKAQSLLEAAQAAIDASDNDNLKIIWEYGNFAERNSPSIESLGEALGLTSEQIDEMFIAANELSV